MARGVHAHAAKKVSVDGFETYVSQVMKEFSADTMAESKEEAYKAAENCVNELKEMSPKSKAPRRKGVRYANE